MTGKNISTHRSLYVGGGGGWGSMLGHEGESDKVKVDKKINL